MRQRVRQAALACAAICPGPIARAIFLRTRLDALDDGERPTPLLDAPPGEFRFEDDF